MCQPTSDKKKEKECKYIIHYCKNKIKNNLIK